MQSAPCPALTKAMAAPPRTKIERYFSLHYGVGCASAAGSERPGGDVDGGMERSDSCVARHHNGLCVICISPAHPIVAQQLVVSSVDYRVPIRAVHGKRKRGGLFVEARTGLCTLSCAGGRRFNVQCSVRGVLIEYNDTLRSNPGIVAQSPLEDGYLAVILPPAGEIASATDALTDADAYAAQTACDA